MLNLEIAFENADGIYFERLVNNFEYDFKTIVNQTQASSFCDGC